MVARAFLGIVAVVGLGLSGSPAAGAEPRSKEEAAGVLFSRHVVPLLSRMGCNAGVCHGTVKGQNGFRLSLFGVDPEMDHQSLVRELGGRRLDLAAPDRSLLLLKAIGKVPHQGGARMSVAGPEYRILRGWIAAGAPLDTLDSSRVRQLRVSPVQQVLKQGEGYSLKVEASFVDGSKEDVTALCTYEVVDPDVASVEKSGRVQARGVGDSAIVVRFGAEPVVAMVVVPREGTEAFPKVSPQNFVDEHILSKLERLRLPPAEVCDDATFLRRASLDVTGALPTPEEIRAFLADKSADKRKKKIDELLNREGHAAVWATRFCDLLKASKWNANFAFDEAAENRRFYEWIRARLREKVPYDQLVERILMATSRERRSQEQWLDEVMALAEENALESPDLKVYAKRRTLDLFWQREGATGLNGTLQVAHAFLGLRLECAQCHRHPHDVWKQDDLLSFANFFTRVKGAAYPNTKELPSKAADMVKRSKDDVKKLNDEVKKLEGKLKDKKTSEEEKEKLKAEIKAIRVRAKTMQDGPKRFGTEIRHQTERISYASVSSPLGTQRSEKLRLLGEAEPVDVAKEQDPRELVIAWMRRPDNPYFARAIVNRVWAHYLGRGIVDPADHLSPLNPPSHPELLQALADGFVKNKFDLQWLHRTILNSRTYQQSCEPHPAARHDRRNYAAFALRRLPAEVLLDAINHATGGKETYPAGLYLPADARAVEVAGAVRSGNEEASLAYAFQIFGRPLRNAAVQCDCERDPAPTIVQTLYLANHPHVRAKISSDGGRVAQILKSQTEPNKQVEEVFLWTVSRMPTAAEMEIGLAYLKGSPTPRKGLEDLMWSLLNTRELLLNH